MSSAGWNKCYNQLSFISRKQKRTIQLNYYYLNTYITKCFIVLWKLLYTAPHCTTVLYWTEPDCNVQNFTSLQMKDQVCTVLFCTSFHFSVLTCTALHFTSVNCTVLHFTSVHCTALHCTGPPWIICIYVAFQPGGPHLTKYSVSARTEAKKRNELHKLLFLEVKGAKTWL